jgi:hypothetical protein
MTTVIVERVSFRNLSGQRVLEQRGLCRWGVWQLEQTIWDGQSVCIVSGLEARVSGFGPGPDVLYLLAEVDGAPRFAAVDSDHRTYILGEPLPGRSAKTQLREVAEQHIGHWLPEDHTIQDDGRDMPSNW